MSKTIAIVGAGPGVGLATAERFGAEGYSVALIARNATSLADMVAGLKTKGVEAAAFAADVFDRTALTKALRDASAHFGSVDVLLYGPNPPPNTMRKPRDIDIENAQTYLDVLLLGAVAAVQTVLPGMLERKSGGLLFSGAVSARYPLVFTGSYGFAAGSVLNYARLLNQDLKADGIYSGMAMISGLVVQRGEEGGLSESGLPKVAAQDVADAHWKLFNEKTAVEAVLGPAEQFKAMSGVV